MGRILHRYEKEHGRASWVIWKTLQDMILIVKSTIIYAEIKIHISLYTPISRRVNMHPPKKFATLVSGERKMSGQGPEGS